MTEFIESKLRFSFAVGVEVFQYDAAPAYKNHLMNFAQRGRKGVDFVATSGQITWLIEVKNFRFATTEEDKNTPIDVVIGSKVWDTLAGLHALKAGIVSGGDYPDHASKALKGQFRVVFHREVNSSRWFNARTDNIDIQIKLRQTLKPFTKDIWVVDTTTAQSIPNICWFVR
jgi:hypothetical protein